MRLTDWDKARLLEWGYKETDFPQIEAAASKTTITRIGNNGEEKWISMKKAEDYLGRAGLLGALARSAFHATAAKIDNVGAEILFDAHAYFKDDCRGESPNV